MKAKFGAIVVDGRNKVGGHVFSKNRAGAYMRTKVTPVNPQTSFQNAVRSRLTGLSQAWRDLTASQREAWNSAVQDFQRTDIFGDLKTPSGFNLYQRLNNNLLTIGEAAIDTPPLVGSVYAPVTLSVAAAAGAGTVAITFTGAIPATDAVKLFATAPVSAGKSFVKSEYRLLAILDNADTSPFAAGTAYVARFGAMTAGQKVFVQMVGVNITTGQEGQPLSASAIVGA